MKKHPQRQNQKQRQSKSDSEKIFEKVKSMYDSFPDFIDKSTKDLLAKYNL